MTEQTNAELVKLAAILSDPNFSLSVPEEAKRVIRTLADRLEAAERRADQAEATAEHLHDEDTREIVALTQERDSAMASYEDYLRIHRERDQLAAVVEKVRSVIERESGWFRYRAEQVSTVLASAPADALREHDAALIEGLADEFAARLPDGTGNGRAYNSHTVARMLREKARQRREEQS